MNDAIVIGGGPAGAALATRLATLGREVVLLERSEGPVDKVCGEFLSNEAVAYLAALDVDLVGLGAVNIHTVRLCMGPRLAEVRLPFPAFSLSRRVLDEALINRAIIEGAMVRRGMRVNALTREGSMWSARTSDGFEFFAKDAFLATGKHDLRTHKRPAGEQDDLIAFKMHWQLTRAQAASLDGHVELMLFRDGYAGLQPIEAGLANLCLVIRRRRMVELEQSWEHILEALCAESPNLEWRLTGAEACSPRPLAVSAIPYGYVCHHSEGVWRLGDQSVVIPSFAGDGMAIALHSAQLAASIYARGGSVDEYQEHLANDVGRQLRLAMMLSRALVWRPGQLALTITAQAWPRLMATTAAHTRISDSALVQAQ